MDSKLQESKLVKEEPVDYNLEAVYIPFVNQELKTEDEACALHESNPQCLVEDDSKPEIPIRNFCFNSMIKEEASEYVESDGIFGIVKSEILPCNEPLIKMETNDLVKEELLLINEEYYEMEDSFSSRIKIENHDISHEATVVLDDMIDATIDRKPSISNETKNINCKSEMGRKTFSCSYCSDTFFSTTLLNSHERSHTSEKLYSCEHCGKKFERKGYLQMHQKIHNGLKLFSCGHCDRKFHRRGYLQMHLKIHSEDNQLVCEYCGQIFYRTESLRLHQKNHTVKTFSCEYCDEKFIRKGYLQMHQKIHNGKKEFSCAHCDKKFNRKGYLQMHLRSHI